MCVNGCNVCARLDIFFVKGFSEKGGMLSKWVQAAHEHLYSLPEDAKLWLRIDPTNESNKLCAACIQKVKRARAKCEHVRRK